MKLRNLTFLGAMSVALFLNARPALAIPDLTDFESDNDVTDHAGNGDPTYNPDPDPNYDWMNDPLLNGDAPPGWYDIRTGGPGIIEEVSSGFSGVPAYNGNAFGVIYPEFSNGTYRFQFDAQVSYELPLSFQVSIYTDPAYGPSMGAGAGGSGNGSNGTPDFWWTNALRNLSGDPGNNYLTETGFTGEILDNGIDSPVWRFTTTSGGNPIIDLPVAEWFTLEVLYEDNGFGLVQAVHNVWSADHATKLYTYTMPAASMFLGPHLVASVGGPKYMWFTYFDQNLKRLLVDDAGIGPPIPEPSSIAFAACGILALCTVAIRRKR